MAVSLLSHDVSDLCIGKPPLRSLPATVTVGEALVALKLCGETFLSVVATPPETATEIAGKICMVDVICYLCSEANISNPAAALKNPVSVLLGKGEGFVRRVEANSSILEALDVILDTTTQTLIVPIHSNKKKNQLQEFCWLTQEDLVRFFLNNIFLFSSIASLSITSLRLVRPSLLSVPHHSPALSSLPFIRSALLNNSSVAVITDDNKLVGEISPITLSSCDETATAALASLSSSDLMAFIDSFTCGGAPESVLHSIKTRLKNQNLLGMLEFINDNELMSALLSSSGSSSSSASSSSEGEEEESVGRMRRPRRMRSGSYSARMGRRSEEAIVCHPESSLVAVMVQALAHRVSCVWVVDEEDYGLVGVVTFADILRVFRDQLN